MCADFDQNNEVHKDAIVYLGMLAVKCYNLRNDESKIVMVRALFYRALERETESNANRRCGLMMMWRWRRNAWWSAQKRPNERMNERASEANISERYSQHRVAIPPFFHAETAHGNRPVLPSKSRAIMLSMFNLSVSAIEPGSLARPEFDTEHLNYKNDRRILLDFTGARCTIRKITLAASYKILAMAVRITAYSTLHSLSPLSSPFFIDEWQSREALARFSILESLEIRVWTSG